MFLSKIRKKRVFFTLFFLATIIFLLIFVKILKISTEKESRIMLFWSWDKGTVEFTNSVTGGNVKIHFDLSKQFNHFNMETDEKTENYYTSGTYGINELLKNETENELFYCSIVGIKFKLGNYFTEIKNSCLNLEILWPPKKLF